MEGRVKLSRTPLSKRFVPNQLKCNIASSRTSRRNIFKEGKEVRKWLEEVAICVVSPFQAVLYVSAMQTGNQATGDA